MRADNYDVPLSLKSNLNRSDYEVESLKVIITGSTCTDAEEVRFQFPIYEDQENSEILLKLLHKFTRAISRHDLWTTLGKEKVYDMFQKCLGGDALDTWVDIVQVEDETS